MKYKTFITFWRGLGGELPPQPPPPPPLDLLQTYQLLTEQEKKEGKFMGITQTSLWKPLTDNQRGDRLLNYW